MNEKLIKQLKERTIALKNDGTLNELRKVLKYAFPLDTGNTTGLYLNYSASNKKDYWTGADTPNLPSHSVKEFLKPENEYPKVMKVSSKPIKTKEVFKNAITRVVFMEKCGKFIAWLDADTIEKSENITATFDYNGGNYYAQSYPHNYRIYSYKDTLQGRIYSSTYLTLTAPVGTAPAAPTNLIATQTCADGCNYSANGWEHNWRIYSYKNVGDQRIYSTTYLDLPSNFVDDNSTTSYDITVSWTAAAGADGYRILKYDPSYNGYNYDAGYDTANTSFVDDGCGNVCFNNYQSYTTTTADLVDNNSQTGYNINVSWNSVTGADGYRILKYDPYYNGYNYDAGYDTTSTSFIDDNCGSVCFDGGLINVGQTTVYSNTATINGSLTLTGPILMQGSPIRLDQSYNFGVIADTSGVTGTDNIFMGHLAGDGVTLTSNSIFLGPLS